MAVINTCLLRTADKLVMVNILGGHLADGGEVGRDRKSDNKAKTAQLSWGFTGLGKN